MECGGKSQRDAAFNQRTVIQSAAVVGALQNPVHPEAHMGTFYTKCKIENAVERSKSVVIPRLLVDTGSDYTWVSAKSLEKIGVEREKKDVLFVLANGQQITRSVGFAIIRLDKHFTIDEVVFAEKGDLFLLGARSLEGLNLRVDSKLKKLVAAGPLTAAQALNSRTKV